MGDLSYSSGDWWALARGAVERLRLRPQVDPKVQLWPRTERRAVSMLLGAIPDPIKEEILSARRLTTDQLSYKLCITFQPGGASERTKLLQNITDSKCGSNVHENLDWIRTWRRFVQRARELQVTLPDGLVLLGALTKCTDVLNGKSPQVAYRLNMIRQQLNLDQLPTAETILSYSEHLQAEAEELTLSVPVKATSAVKAAALGVSPPPGIPQYPQNESEQKSPNPKKKACRYWMGEKECSRGINVTLVMPLWIPKVIDVSTVLRLVTPDVNVLGKLQGLTLSLIPPKRGLPRCPNQVDKGPLKSLGGVWGKIVTLEKLLGMLPL